MNLVKYRYFILLSCFILFLMGNKTSAGDEDGVLLLLTDSVKRVDGSIEEWTLHTRERLTEESN